MIRLSYLYKIQIWVATALIMFQISSCKSKDDKNLAERAAGDIDAYEKSPVNAIEQARPTIMVIPSDNLMKRYGALKTEKIEGVNTNIYDYNKYLLANSDNKTILSLISQNFVDENYPIQDLEQTLKQIQNQEITDYVDKIGTDAKTQLITVAQPDLIIELDYAKKMNMRGKMDCTYSYTLNVIDPYTNNIIASATQSDLKGENVQSAISKKLKNNLTKINSDIVKSFSDILTRGRNITVRINVASSCPFNLDARTYSGSTYADWIVDYIKTHTVKGAYKLQRNTPKELYFVNCRIKLLGEGNVQFGVYDWAREMTTSLYNNLGVESTNKAQGLGEVVITINGLK